MRLDLAPGLAWPTACSGAAPPSKQIPPHVIRPNLSCQIVKAQQRAQFEKAFYENYPRKELVRQRGSQPMLEDKRTPQDEISALKSSAQKGDAAAQTWLGWKSSNGQGVPQNWEEALNWHSKAAEQGVLQRRTIWVQCAKTCRDSYSSQRPSIADKFRGSLQVELPCRCSRLYQGGKQSG